MTNIELVKRIAEIIDSNSDDPADDLIRCGRAMQDIGEAIKSSSVSDQRAVIRSALALFGGG